MATIAHHCIKNHPGNQIMRNFYRPTKDEKGAQAVPHILGLTASLIMRLKITDIRWVLVKTSPGKNGFSSHVIGRLKVITKPLAGRPNYNNKSSWDHLSQGAEIAFYPLQGRINCRVFPNGCWHLLDWLLKNFSCLKAAMEIQRSHLTHLVQSKSKPLHKSSRARTQFKPLSMSMNNVNTMSSDDNKFNISDMLFWSHCGLQRKWKCQSILKSCIKHTKVYNELSWLYPQVFFHSFEL